MYQSLGTRRTPQQKGKDMSTEGLKGIDALRRGLLEHAQEVKTKAAETLGATTDWTVTPGPLHGSEVDCGLAGTVMRFVPPVAGLVRGEVAFDGDAHMRNRPVGGILDALRGFGIAISDGDRLPFTVSGSGSVDGGTVQVII